MHLPTLLIAKAQTASVRLFRTLPAILFAAVTLQTTTAVGQVASGLVASLRIQDETGPDMNLNLKNWITFNEETGQLKLVAPGTNLGSSGWTWAQNATVPVPGQEASVNATVLRWGNENRSTISIMDIAGKIDPTMNYSFAVKNNTAVTQTYTLVFGEAMVPPINGDYTVQADVGYTLSTTTPTATIAPVGLAPKFQLLQLSANGGVTTFNAGVDVGTTLSRITNGTSISSDDSGTINGTTGLFLNYWEFRTSFTLTPGDSIGISGSAEIIPIPEPSTYALLAGCAVFGLIALRRTNRPSRSLAPEGVA